MDTESFVDAVCLHISPECHNIHSCFICAKPIANTSNLIRHFKDIELKRYPKRRPEIDFACELLKAERAKCRCRANFETRYYHKMHQLFCVKNNVPPTPATSSQGISTQTTMSTAIATSKTTSMATATSTASVLATPPPMAEKNLRAAPTNSLSSSSSYSNQRANMATPGGYSRPSGGRGKKASTTINVPLHAATSPETTPPYVPPLAGHNTNPPPITVGKLTPGEMRPIQLLNNRTNYNDFLSQIYKKDQVQVYRHINSCLFSKERGDVAMFDKIYLEGREPKHYPIRLSRTPEHVIFIKSNGDMIEVRVGYVLKILTENMINCFLRVSIDVLQTNVVNDHKDPGYVLDGFNLREWSNHPLDYRAPAYQRRLGLALIDRLQERYRQHGVHLP